MNVTLYFTIGAISGGVFLSISVMVWLSVISSLIRSYITEKNCNPDVGKWIGDKIGYITGSCCYDIEDVLIFSLLPLGVGALFLLAWPLMIVVLVFYIILRTLRFAYRIKTAIVKLSHNKKCLKDYHDHETPKMEF